MFKQIKYFISVVKCNSFTEAAEECYISQSAISQQIQALESELGVQLIVRENRKFHLTPAGEFFYAKSQNLLQEADALIDQTKRIGQSTRKKLRIGFLNNYVGSELHSAVADFSFEHPDIDIEVKSGTHEELFDMHRENAIDMMFSDQRRAFSDKFHNIYVFTAYAHIEISAKHPLSKKQNLKIQDLQEMPCIIVSDKSHTEKEKEFYNSYVGFSGNYLETDNLENARMQVSAGRGFLILDGAKDLPQMGTTIKRLPFYDNGIQRETKYYIYWKKDKTDGIYQQFCDTLINTFQS